MDNKAKGYALTFASSGMIGISFVANAMAVKEISSPIIGPFYVFLAAFIASLILVLQRKEIDHMFHSMKKYRKTVVSIGILNAIGSISLFFALDILGPSLTGFFSRFSTIFIVILSVLFLGERLGKIEIIGAIIILIGSMSISYTSGHTIAEGMAFALLSAIMLAIVQTLSKKYIEQIQPASLNALRTLFLFLSVLLIIGFTDNFYVPSMPTMALLFTAGLTGAFLSAYLRYKAMELIDLSKIALIRAMDPLVIGTYSFFLLGEIMTTTELIGSFIVFAGLMIFMLGNNKNSVVA
ncbi:MAG: DMT family transporter [Candidatus Aenigmarchaeota archaeon]|nr:DMT family transporter [Candidatus Aenigmarchaeota archaeon]